MSGVTIGLEPGEEIAMPNTGAKAAPTPAPLNITADSFRRNADLVSWWDAVLKSEGGRAMMEALESISPSRLAPFRPVSEHPLVDYGENRGAEHMLANMRLLAVFKEPGRMSVVRETYNPDLAEVQHDLEMLAARKRQREEQARDAGPKAAPKKGRKK